MADSAAVKTPARKLWIFWIASGITAILGLIVSVQWPAIE